MTTTTTSEATTTTNATIKPTATIDITMAVPLTEVADVDAAADRIEDALMPIVSESNPFGADGEVVMTVTISEKRKRRSTESVANVHVQYSGTETVNIDATELADSVVESSRDGLSDSALADLVDQSKLDTLSAIITVKNLPEKMKVTTTAKSTTKTNEEKPTSSAVFAAISMCTMLNILL